MAAAGEDFYTDVVRAGYRGPYLRDIAGRVAAGELDLEALADPERPDAEIEETLLALPGIGPYASAHMLLVLGRCTRLVLDSWTRPTYAKLVGRKKVADRTIERRFRRYGVHAGLAFWLLLTRDWVQST
jgi:N-glycosylase/DNA lyase